MRPVHVKRNPNTRAPEVWCVCIRGLRRLRDFLGDESAVWPETGELGCCDVESSRGWGIGSFDRGTEGSRSVERGCNGGMHGSRVARCSKHGWVRITDTRATKRGLKRRGFECRCVPVPSQRVHVLGMFLIKLLCCRLQRPQAAWALRQSLIPPSSFNRPSHMDLRRSIYRRRRLASRRVACRALATISRTRRPQG